MNATLLSRTARYCSVFSGGSTPTILGRLMLPEEKPATPDPLEIARLRATYVVLFLIVALSILAVLVPERLDLGVFATLMGGLLGLLGLGAIVRFTSTK